tara:strand:- start:400 stop:726 length:327 start_codon:yes stop_codon:yes gene_type:complete
MVYNTLKEHQKEFERRGNKMIRLFRCRRSVRSRNRQFNRWLLHSLTCHASGWTRTGCNLTRNGIFVTPTGEVTYDGCPVKMNCLQKRRLRKIYRSHIAMEAIAKGDNE